MLVGAFVLQNVLWIALVPLPRAGGQLPARPCRRRCRGSARQRRRDGHLDRLPVRRGRDRRALEARVAATTAGAAAGGRRHLRARALRRRQPGRPRCGWPGSRSSRCSRSPRAFLIGLLRSRLARGGLADLFLRAARRCAAPSSQAALARALGDPDLTVVHADGGPLPPPAEGRRAVPIEREGRAIAALALRRVARRRPRAGRGGHRGGRDRARERAAARAVGGAARRAAGVARAHRERRRRRSGGGSSATSTTARSSGSWRWRCSCACSRCRSAPTPWRRRSW